MSGKLVPIGNLEDSKKFPVGSNLPINKKNPCGFVGSGINRQVLPTLGPGAALAGPIAGGGSGAAAISDAIYIIIYTIKIIYMT